MDPALRTASIACAVVATLTWLTAAFTRECSWVDRLWSILPPAYVAFFAYASGWDARLLLMTACATAWGARLTWNFARKGGYAKGGEDYRWAELRKRMSPALFQLFNLVFIAGFQNALLLAIALPAWAARGRRGAPLGWSFQQDKKAKRARGEPVLEAPPPPATITSSRPSPEESSPRSIRRAPRRSPSRARGPGRSPARARAS